MTDHANEIRDVLMWAQAYAPDRLAHRLIDAEESLRSLLADHAAEVERLKAAGRILTRQRDEARADAETLRGLLREAWTTDEFPMPADGEMVDAEVTAARERWYAKYDALSGRIEDALAAAQEPPAERTSSEPNGCERVHSGECSGSDDPWCACTDQMLRAAAQELPAEGAAT